MGTYCYTARAGYKTIDGTNIGRYGYSYKPGWGDYDNPVINRKLAAGDRAADKLNSAGVKHFIMGEYDYARQYGEVLVYQREQLGGSYLDGGQWPGQPVGKLIPDGRRLKFVGI